MRPILKIIGCCALLAGTAYAAVTGGRHTDNKTVFYQKYPVGSGHAAWAVQASLDAVAYMTTVQAGLGLQFVNQPTGSNYDISFQDVFPTLGVDTVYADHVCTEFGGTFPHDWFNKCRVELPSTIIPGTIGYQCMTVEHFGVGVTQNAAKAVFVHEIGHHLGLGHTGVGDCGNKAMAYGCTCAQLNAQGGHFASDELALIKSVMAPALNDPEF